MQTTFDLNYDQKRPGFFGPFGGRYSPEVLVPALDQLESIYNECRQDVEFQAELQRLSSEYIGRPSALTLAPRLTAEWGGATVYLKREDLNHTGSHKLNNALGQVLLTLRMGKRRVIAETGA
ncbi:MAG: pyridoxal-phosphate dependent enzyme, partial [Leptospiraceae bacterium]|nr:pyridoxal-phosphate dependent enzyme [Leptospiraceae bacterium]